MYNATDKKIKTVAGDDSAANLGDGGPATNANLRDAWKVAVDSAGNFYFPDRAYSRIRMVNVTTNIITTVSGNGDMGSGGEGISATAAYHNHPLGIAIDAFDNLLVADTNSHVVR